MKRFKKITFNLFFEYFIVFRIRVITQKQGEISVFLLKFLVSADLWNFIFNNNLLFIFFVINNANLVVNTLNLID